MLTREERAKAEDLFGRDPDATMKDVERTLGRRPDGMVDALELDILRSRAKDEAKAAGAKPEAAAKADAEKADEPKPEAAKAADGAKPFARVRIEVAMTVRGKDDFALSLRSNPAETSDEDDRGLLVKAAILKLVANRACGQIGDLLDSAWIDRAAEDAARELEARLGMPKDA